MQPRKEAKQEASLIKEEERRLKDEEIDKGQGEKSQQKERRAEHGDYLVARLRSGVYHAFDLHIDTVRKHEDILERLTLDESPQAGARL